MKIGVIGGNGNLGKRVCRQAIERGWEVVCYDAYVPEVNETGAVQAGVGLFDLTREEVSGYDALISCFGSGFKADPALNLQAYRKYMELTADQNIHLIAIGGAGSLFTDETHTQYCYQTPEHPDFLREISRNIRMGIDELKETENVAWTVVHPSSFFDPEGPKTGSYRVGTQGHLLFNDQGKSHVMYEDLAMAMLDIAEQDLYHSLEVTILTDPEPAA